VYNRYENALEDLFDRDEAIQANAVRALKQLVGPIEYPHEYLVVSAGDTMPRRAVWASQLTVDTSEQQELLANVLDDSSKGSVAEAAYILGVLTATGVSPVVEVDDAYANKMYSLAADYGSLSGHLAMAHRYEQGFNVPKSCSIAYGHLKVCARAICVRPSCSGPT
jgi:TPR repeat protein